MAQRQLSRLTSDIGEEMDFPEAFESQPLWSHRNNVHPPQHILHATGSTLLQKWDANDSVERIVMRELQRANGIYASADAGLASPSLASVNDIPYRDLEYLNADADEHTDLGQTSQLGSSCRSTEFGVTFVEGPACLELFPSQLLVQLKLAYSLSGKNRPKCVSTKQSVTVRWIDTTTAKSNGKAWFADFKSGEELLAARFLVPLNGQAIVVRKQIGVLPHGSSDAIVYYSRSGPCENLGESKIKTFVTYWQIWDPDSKTAYFVKRMSQPKLPAKDNAQYGLRSPLSNEFADNDTVEVLEPNTAIETNPAKRKLRSPKYSEGDHLKVQRLDLTNPSDRTSSKRKIGPLSEIELSDLGKDHHGHTFRKHPKPMNPNQSSHKPSSTKTEPVFVFKSNDRLRTLRYRSFAVCNSAQKLFVNALVAGAATQDTLVLSVRVGLNEPMQIVRGDADDFDKVLESIKYAKIGGAIEIEVVAEQIEI